MKKRIIVRRNIYNYNYEEYIKIDGTWTLIYSDNTNDFINHISNKEINKVIIFNDMLGIKSNNDLIIIENYSKICNDPIFSELNEKIKSFTTNKNLLNKKKALQKENKYKKALISAKVLCCATITGILIMTLVSGSLELSNQEENFNKTSLIKESIVLEDKNNTKKIATVEHQKKAPVIKEVKTLKKIEEPKLSKEEELFISKVKEYSSMFFIDYEDALKIIKENKDGIKNNYPNQEVGIIRVLAKKFYNNYDIDKTPIIEDTSSLEKEKLIIKFANVYGINSVDTLATMLAVHRLETGNGTSDACIYKNNFGGLRARNSQTGKYYVMSFKTKEIGAEAFVRTFIKIKNASIKSKNYNPNRSLEENMNRIYCGEPSWPNKVYKLKQEVINDYDLQEYIIKDKEQVLIK